MTARASPSMSARKALPACAHRSPIAWASTPKAVHVLTGQVGGSFGMKGVLFPEYVCLLHGARALGRPVKWTDERSGSFFSDSHGRDQEFDRRARARQRGQFPRRALDRLRRYGRLPFADGADPRHAQHRQERAEHVPHAVDRGVLQVRVHQHLADRAVSRRRSAGRQLLHGAADRRRGGRDGHRSARAAPAQPDPPARSSLQDRVGSHL